MTNTLHNIISKWTRIGAAFDAIIAKKTPDLEQLILDTAEVVPLDPRLLTVAASWLATYPEFVARHRLAASAQHVSNEHKPKLGFLLALASERAATSHFKSTIDQCPAQQPARPLFKVQQDNPVWRRIAESEASAIAKRWGLWCQQIELKTDAIRPAAWIIEQNPTFFDRAVLRGSLRLSIIETLRHNPDAGISELQLSKACAANRSAIRSALKGLDHACYIEREERGNRTIIRLATPPVIQPAA